MIGSMIVGFLIGLIASAISNRGERMGCIGKTFVGWLGAFVGQLLFGNWGPMLADTAHAVTPQGCSDCSWAHGFRYCFTPLPGCFSPFRGDW